MKDSICLIWNWGQPQIGGKEGNWRFTILVWLIQTQRPLVINIGTQPNPQPSQVVHEFKKWKSCHHKQSKVCSLPFYHSKGERSNSVMSLGIEFSTKTDYLRRQACLNECLVFSFFHYGQRAELGPRRKSQRIRTKGLHSLLKLIPSKHPWCLALGRGPRLLP